VPRRVAGDHQRGVRSNPSPGKSSWEHLEHSLEDIDPSPKTVKRLKEIETMLKRYVE